MRPCTGAAAAYWREVWHTSPPVRAVSLPSLTDDLLNTVASICHTCSSRPINPFHLHALEKEMATHSSVLAWRIPGTREPGGLLSMGSHRVRHDWSDLVVIVVIPPIDHSFLDCMFFRLYIFPLWPLLSIIFVSSYFSAQFFVMYELCFKGTLMVFIFTCMLFLDAHSLSSSSVVHQLPLKK